MLFTAIEGGHLHYAVNRGTGRPVVFLNSLGTDLRIWDDLLAYLPGVPGLRYDKRGHGLSSLNGDMTMAAHVADVVAMIEANGLRGAMLCGISVGGLIAIGVAGARPDLVSGLVLCNTAARIGTPEAWAERIAAVEAGGIEALADSLMEKWFSPGFRLEHPVEVEGWRTMVTRCPKPGYLGVCEAIRDTDFTGMARALTLPVAIVGGADDGSTPPEIVAQLASTIPGSELTMFEDCAHMSCIEQAAALADLVASFREGLPGDFP